MAEEEEGVRRQRLARMALSISYALVSIAGVGSLAILTAPFMRYAELAASPMPIYAGAGAMAVLVLIGQRRWRTVTVAVAACAVPVAAVFPYLPFQKNGSIGQADLVMVSANLNGEADDFSWVETLVNEHEPDVLLLQEFTPAAEAQLKGLQTAYPHRLVHAKPNVLGLAIYSRLPLTDTAKEWLAPRTYATLFATVTLSGKPVRLVNFHAPPPVRDDYYQTRNAVLQALDARLHEHDQVIVAGDFNATPWSPHFRALVRAGGFHEARRGRGNLGTWPAASAAFSIPIDHILFRDAIRSDFLKIDSGYSDHRVLVGGFSIR